MTIFQKIKTIILKIWAWIIHFFINKIHGSKKKENKDDKLKIKYKADVRYNGELSADVIAMYFGIMPEEVCRVLANKNYKLDKDLILQLIDRDLDNEQKISLLKEDISILLNGNSKEYERNVEEAYYKYSKVNYVILTTMLIDELSKELRLINEAYTKNQCNKYQFIEKIRYIEEKIANLEKISNNEEVRKEIEGLKNDLYTKRKDKYDLLYNREVFINLQKQCDECAKQVEIKEAEAIKEKKQKELDREKKQKELQKQKEELRKEKMRTENILKRFLDMKLARRILLLHELKKMRNGENVELVQSTLRSYYDFLSGIGYEFNFARNKDKLEVVRLYNDTLRNICILQNEPYIPVEHINIKLSEMLQETLDNQYYLNQLLLERRHVDIEESEISMQVNEKLTSALEKEKQREIAKGKPKVLEKKLVNK